MVVYASVYQGCAVVAVLIASTASLASLVWEASTAYTVSLVASIGTEPNTWVPHQPLQLLLLWGVGCGGPAHTWEHSPAMDPFGKNPQIVTCLPAQG